MAFSKAPRVLITEEVAIVTNPGPGDYNPKDDKKIRAAKIYAEPAERSEKFVSEPNYLAPKDTSKITAKLGSRWEMPKPNLFNNSHYNNNAFVLLDQF